MNSKRDVSWKTSTLNVLKSTSFAKLRFNTFIDNLSAQMWPQGSWQYKNRMNKIQHVHIRYQLFDSLKPEKSFIEQFLNGWKTCRKTILLNRNHLIFREQIRRKYFQSMAIALLNPPALRFIHGELKTVSLFLIYSEQHTKITGLFILFWET